MNFNIDGSVIDKLIYYITYPIKLLFKISYSIYKSRGFNVNLNNLTSSEIIIIKKYYSASLNKFSPTGQTIPENKETLPLINNLCSRNILEPQSDYERLNNYNGFGVIYKMNPYAADKLNRKQNITISL